MGIGTLEDDKSHGEFESLRAQDLPVAVRKANLSSVTGVFKGAPRSAQSGISSFKDLLTTNENIFDDPCQISTWAQGKLQTRCDPQLMQPFLSRTRGTPEINV